jgi:acetyl esterase/lipase
MTIARLLWITVLALLASACEPTEVMNRIERDRGNDIATNIIFDEATGLKLDVYTPHAARNAPTIVFWGGGRWTNGKKEDFEFVGQRLASESFVVVIADYRKYPKVRFPLFVQDAANAMKWTRNNIAKYGGSPDKLFVMGHSAGAHIAAMLALDPDYLKAVGMDNGRLAGMIGLAGPYDFMPITDPQLRDLFYPPENFEQSQPIFYADGRNPPLFLIHGQDDEDVWVKNTRNLADAVRRAGGPVETLIYDKLSHSCAVAVLSSSLAISCGHPQPDPLREIVRFVRAQAKTATP